MAQKRKQNYKLVKGGKADKKGKRKKPSGGKGDLFSSGRFAKPAKKGLSGRLKIGLLIGAAVCIVLAGALVFVQAQFHVETVSVEGNVHYTKEEIEQMVIKDRLSANSIYLSFKYRDKEILNIPFIEKMSGWIRPTALRSAYMKNRWQAMWNTWGATCILTGRVSSWSRRRQRPPGCRR